MSIVMRRRRSRRNRDASLVRAAERRWSLRAIAHYLDDAFLADADMRNDVVDDAGLKVSARAAASTVRNAAVLALQVAASDDGHDGPLARNLVYLGEVVGMSPLDRELLALALATDNRRGVYDALGRATEIGPTNLRRETYDCLAALLDCTPAELEAAMAPKGTLVTTGLLVVDWASDADQRLQVVDAAKTALLRPTASAEELLAQFVEVAATAELTVDDYSHVRQEVTMMQRFFAHATANQLAGANVLLHGPPGTGKTQLARVIAAALNLRLFAARVSDSDDDPLDRRDRLRSFQLCQALLQRQHQALVLFDEVEDAFPEDSNGALSLRHGGKNKAWSNRLLESNPVPAIWISNVVSHLDPAVLRRFDLIVELKEPPRQTRLKMLAKALPPDGVSPQWLQRAADDEMLTPADVARASKVALALATDGTPLETAMDWALQGHKSLQTGGQRPTYRVDHGTYDLQFVNTDVALPKLVERLRAKPHASICLSGLPGTGKTAFCAHLAQELGIPFLHARASDLLSKWVGDNEKNIAGMFRKAKAQNAVLLLDEADGMLRDRRKARSGWELTMVNEMLCQMEVHEGIFCCATNLAAELDQASLRRFSLKVEFRPLKPEQLVQVFFRTLQQMGTAGDALDPVTQAQLARLGSVCLGDVHAARRNRSLFDDVTTAEELLDALKAELAAKGPGTKALGFGVG